MKNENKNGLWKDKKCGGIVFFKISEKWKLGTCSL